MNDLVSVLVVIFHFFSPLLTFFMTGCRALPQTQFLLSPVNRWFFITAVFLSFFSQAAVSQWRVTTPRDTAIVSAKQKIFVTSKIQLTSGVEMWLSPSGSFTEGDGSTTFTLDGGYTYSA